MPLVDLNDVTLALETRHRKPVANFYCKRDCDDGDIAKVRELKQLYTKAVHRPVGPSRAYNCHGLTFGARRTGINDPAAVANILVEDGYRPLKLNEQVLTGDVAIYRNTQEITHSGVVVMVDSQPWVLSKWGIYQEAIHRPYDCPYRDANVQFYRLER